MIFQNVNMSLTSKLESQPLTFHVPQSINHFINKDKLPLAVNIVHTLNTIIYM